MAKKAKPTNGAAPRPKKARQGFLPEMEPPRIEEIDNAADAYVEVRDQRMRLGETEVERRAVLQALMKKHALTTYEYDGKVVAIAVGEKVSVQARKAESN